MKRIGIVERYELERQGCTSTDWNDVWLADNCDISCIRNVHFENKVEIGAIKELRQATIADCRIGAGCKIINIHGCLSGLKIGRGVTIENTGIIKADAEASFGINTEVSVLDETGSRMVNIFPGLSAQTALLMTMRPRWAEQTYIPMLKQKWDDYKFPYHIADGAIIRDCRLIQNVYIGKEVNVIGADRLINGSIINNAASGLALAGIDGTVDAENFIIEDGFIGSGVLLRNVYVGQGASLEKGFTAHDSLFFANSSMENGEACAMFAGPYTVSMHKSTLLIGAQSSFMNAGSATNFSNHMYKLGPVHWGVMERGVKTSSGAYIMWGARIGAFSLIMGNHKHHPDTSMFPFSYLFGDDKGKTTAAPGLMLRSCGLIRDEQKWPLRDKRLKRRLPLLDNICYEVLNPVTVQTMLDSLPLLAHLAGSEPDANGLVHHGAVALKPSAALKGHRLYSLAITAYLYRKSHDSRYQEADPDKAPEKWVDWGGQIVPTDTLAQIFNHDIQEMPEIILSRVFNEYHTLELCWVKKIIRDEWSDKIKTAPQDVVELESLIESDKTAYKSSLTSEISLNTTY